MHAFVDESIRGSTYLICAILVSQGDLSDVRRVLVGLRLPGQERIHLYKESQSRRRLILDRVARLPVRARIYSATGNRLKARDACIRAMVPDLLKQQVGRLAIEPIETLQAHDRASVQRALNRVSSASQLVVEHSPPRLEPALWAADVVAWGYGAKGDWRRRISGLIEAKIDLEKREARIVSVRRSSGLTS